MMSACSSTALTTRGDFTNLKINNVKSKIGNRQQPKTFAHRRRAYQCTKVRASAR